MKTLCFVAFLGLAAPALAQEVAAAPQPDANVDEVVVPGHRPENLFAEIERLEGSVYQRFNELNSNDDFDIHCSTGADRLEHPLTQCAPNFVIEAESRAAEDAVHGARTTGRSRNDEYVAIVQEKSRQLNEEMKRVARQDEQFLRDLVRLDELRQLQANEKQQRRNR
jgi:hypothetical protein